jgi:hypothetical protein
VHIDEEETAQPQLPTFYQEVCGNAKHSQKAASHITDGVTGIVDKVQLLLVYWEKKYKAIWETDKDAFIRSPFYSLLHPNPKSHPPPRIS